MSECGTGFPESVTVVNRWKIHWRRTYWNKRNDGCLTWVIVESEDSPGFYAFGIWEDM